MPDPGTIVMLLAACIGLWVLWIVLWISFVAFLTWLHGGKRWAERNYSSEDLKRLLEFGQ
jgi:biopolymer transport protein ExbB/TolQ